MCVHMHLVSTLFVLQSYRLYRCCGLIPSGPYVLIRRWSLNACCSQRLLTRRPAGNVTVAQTMTVCAFSFSSPCLADLPPPAIRERPPGCKTVFVGGLPENATEQLIVEIFGQCGEIIAIRKSKKNFCHIRFAEEFTVDKALFLSGEQASSVFFVKQSGV